MRCPLDSSECGIFFFIRKETKKSNILLVSLIIVLIIFIVITVFLITYGYHLLNKINNKVKKRANELEEDYEYIPEKKNDNSKKIELPLVNNLGI